MEYEIVTLDEKIFVGLDAETSNDDPKMSAVIGGLWKRFYEDGIYQEIKHTANEYAFALYSDYSQQGYHILVGKEVSSVENNELTVKKIPGGRYAKFKIHGNMVTAVSEAWEKIWEMDLDRTFTGDFEVYYNADWDNAEIEIYIAVK